MVHIVPKWNTKYCLTLFGLWHMVVNSYLEYFENSKFTSNIGHFGRHLGFAIIIAISCNNLFAKCWLTQVLTTNITMESLIWWKLLVCLIWRPSWTPSWISQIAQGWQDVIRRILKVRGLRYQKPSKHFVSTAKQGSTKNGLNSAGLPLYLFLCQ